MGKHVVAMCCLVAILASGMAYGFDPATDPDLIGWWTCDDGQGTTVTDASVNGRDGTIQDSVEWVEGVHGGALSFTGGLVEIPAIDMALTEATMAAWIKPNGSQPEWSAFMFTRGSATGFNLSGLQLMYHWGDSSATWGYSSGVNIVDGEWNFVALTISADEAVFYLGTEASATNSASHGSVDWNANIYLGGDGSGSFDARRLSDAALDDVSLYSRALTADEIALLQRGLSDPSLAGGPSPANGSVDVEYKGTVLSWQPGQYPGTHNVYFGTDLDEVTNATVPTSAGQDANSYDPGRLDFGQTYYWRVDEVNQSADHTVYPGDVWSFTLEPYAVQVPGDAIEVTASSEDNEYSLATHVIDGSGLSEDGTHSTDSSHMWFTSNGDLEPWIQFEFNAPKKLDTMKIWNSNNTAESMVGWGVQGVQIEYSLDGENWDVLEGVTQLTRAPGQPTYSGEEVVLNGVTAKYVRLVIESNWSLFVASCSLSEVQFFAIPVSARTPMPATGATDVSPAVVTSWRSGREADQHTVYVGIDPNAVAAGTVDSSMSNVNSLDMTVFDLQMGTEYFWMVEEVNDAQDPATWSGDVWSFTTSEVVMIEDFESYTNITPNRAFQTWIDGFGYTTPDPGNPGNNTGSAIGHYIWDDYGPPEYDYIMELDYVHEGSQAMPIYYDNSGSNGKYTYSQVDLALDSQDWTLHGAQTLVIYFFGQPGNTGGQVYAKVNGAKVLYDGNANDIKMAQWHPWPIDLSSLNTSLNNVTSIHIGIDGSNANGVIFVDDIFLSTQPAEYITPVQPTTDGLMLQYKFDEGSGSTVIDSSGNGYNGTFEAIPAWVTGVSGTAASFNGVSSFVSTGQTGLLNDMTAFTITCWLTGDFSTADRSGIVGQNDCIEYAMASANTLEIWTPGGGMLNYLWPYGAEDGWHQVTAVGDGTSLTLYVDGRVVATGGTALDEEDENGYGAAEYPVNIAGGGISDAEGNFLEADIDDVRIYNRALTPAEVAGLAGITEPIYKAQ